MKVFGTAFDRERIPSVSDVQHWFESRELPCRIDSLTIDTGHSILSGSVLGQRTFGDVFVKPNHGEQRWFWMVTEDQVAFGDSLFATGPSGNALDLLFMLWTTSALSFFTGRSEVLVQDSPLLHPVDGMVNKYLWLLDECRLLLALLENGGERDYCFLDGDSIQLMTRESDYDRACRILNLQSQYVIEPEDGLDFRKERVAFRLSRAGLERARSLARFHHDSSSRAHLSLLEMKRL